MQDVALFTGYALLAAVACLAAWWSHRAADRAADSATRLTQSRGRIVALEHAVEQLDAKFRQLNGRLNATLHRKPRVIDVDSQDGFEFAVPPAADGALDPELAAELELQRASAKGPQ